MKLEKIKSNRPWIDSSGKIYADSAIKRLSQNWDAETWNSFLTDTVDNPNRKPELSRQELIQLSNENGLESWNQFISKPSTDERKEQLRQFICDHLSEQQREVIRHAFWGQLTRRQIATVLRINDRTVQRYKAVSLNKFRQLFQISAPHGSLVEGQNQNPSSPEDLFNQEVFKEEYQLLNSENENTGAA